MCHRILQDPDSYFLECPKGNWSYLVGLKLVGLTHDGDGMPYLYQPFEDGDYLIVPEPDLGRVLITCHSPKREQLVDLSLCLPVIRKTVSIFLPGGIHLYSLRSTLEGGIDFPIYAKDMNIGLELMAAFTPADIIMFDGTDISVQQFYILNPERHQLVDASDFWQEMYKASWAFIQDLLKEAGHAEGSL